MQYSAALMVQSARAGSAVPVTIRSVGLVGAPGSPTVLVAHHVSLNATQTGAIRARGVTAPCTRAGAEGVVHRP